MTTPHEQVPEFETRNNFLWFLLGLRSVAGALVEELKQPREPGSRPPDEIEPKASGPSGSLLR
jgi:hypothetical protein